MLRETSFALLAVASALFSAGCTTSSQPVILRSLEASGKFSSLCLGTKNPTATIPLFEPRNIDDCPDTSVVDGEARHAFSMVTQTTRGEVALVDLSLGQVSDSEPTVPGYNFSTVGSQPTGIVSTPGSLATFVGVAEVGKEGIFALPTSCVVPRPPSAPLRDLTTWPACRLPSAPGEIALIIDPPSDVSVPDVYRQHCDEAPSKAVPQDPHLPSASECPADLSTETKLPGRRKLVVSLPDRKELVVIDAQDLLDRDPGKYEPCDFEQQLPLEAHIPTGEIDQEVPPDLDISKGKPEGFAHPPRPETFSVQPAGFAQVEDATTKEHRLFVGDLTAPVIHEVDTSDVCKLTESTKPLLPVAFTDPTRIVTASRLAASPLTIPAQGAPLNSASRYLYAIDEFDTGSVMMFDISPGATNKTPLLRPHSTLLPFEPPDRIAFNSPAKDITFAPRDHVAVDPATGTQQIGQFCNPDPALPLMDPGAIYRPSLDLTTGAAPNLLRGVFGFVALESGYVAVIDVQDFDAPCRRPIYPNTGHVEDFRGCANDAPLSRGAKTYETSSGPTVTDEVTCNAIETNRSRSSAALRDDLTLGTHAPSLRSLPTLISDKGRTLATNTTQDGLRQPRMLGVDFSATDKAEVWVGTTLFATGDRTNPLVIDPAAADQSSLVLSFKEPRVFSPQENFSAVFEGVTSRVSTAGRLTLRNHLFTLDDSGASFCDSGVQDESIAQFRATHHDYNVAPEDVVRFGTDHADYVEITSDLLPSATDVYWQNRQPGASCGGADPNAPGAGFLLCQTQYGTAAAPNKNREFRVVGAGRNQLKIEPRNGTPGQAEKLEELAACCFPTALSYVVRASNEWVVRGSLSGYHHDEITSADGHSCALSSDPLKSRLQSRVLEVSCSGKNGVSDCAPNASGQGTIGVAGSSIGCVYSAGAPLAQVLPANDETGCVYDGLFASFVIYKGSDPSLKDYEYDWSVIGGFSPLLINLSATSDTNTSPLAMQFSQARDALLIADGSTKGIVAVDLSTFAISLYY